MSTIILKPEGKSLHIKLNRPNVHNAFNPEMIQELTGIFSDQKDLAQYKALVLRGEGESFCAGGDINWMKSMAQYSIAENLKDAEELFNMFDSIKNCPVPIIGLVHGNVFGGGLGLVATCDIVYAEENTKFCFSEAKLGLVPAVITPFVREKVSSQFMRDVMLSAEVFSVHKALELGLIHRFGDQKTMYDEILKKIEGISKCGPEAIRATKQMLNDLEGMSWSQSKTYFTKLISHRRVSPEGQEGLKAFLEKRKPNWVTRES